jgi:hypothetical protein
MKEWPRVRDGAVLSDVIEFAKRLELLGKQYGCPQLAEFALTLRASAESFSIDRLESTMKEFPGLISELELSAAA